ncbi:non-heme iron oxygenase ferredoxin subunit [Jonesia quinghaiensis]|uniref:non-heme iron oxygenase ferredoxin subunit n=1 Tax=Jonesia quinghaiensis TaxID=262806 RepID=UPI00041BA93A|nr:non-heme iron oxygenase ferredoxin subunit [Jonesia quinghaiensis]
MSAQLACKVSDVPQGTALRVELDTADGREVAVAVVHDEEGTIHAIFDECSHGAVPLSDGEVEGCFIECWLHGSQFDLTSGMPCQLPASRPVPVYPVSINGEDVLVDVDSPKTVK